MGLFKKLFGSEAPAEMSGTCDLCNVGCRGKVITAKRMAGAAKRGFCPSSAREMLSMVGLGPEGWQQDAISGSSSHSDWLVCDSCMKELERHL